MNEPSRMPVGVIEGFFGRPWNWRDRADYAEFLAGLRFGFYVYAPKSEGYLRQRWREAWPDAEIDPIVKTSNVYRENGVNFGVGLSPYALRWDDYDREVAAVRAKVRQLNDIGAALLCILFDDMYGAIPGLAEKQVRLVEQICDVSTADRFILCPTYYSFDPLLEKTFGKMPDNYLAELGRLLDPQVDIFWTGPKVCSRRYPEAHLTEVTTLLRRRPFLWDNYPVNDSKAMAPFLHVGPFRDRPFSLRSLIAGHAVNPMNQAWLSRIPLRTLADSYRMGAAYEPVDAFEAACRDLCGAELGGMVIEDADLFQKTGLEEMSAETREAAIRRYAAFGDNPYAREIVGWLEGAYAFDPACLL